MEKEREEEKKKRMESKNKDGNHERKHGKHEEKPKQRDGKEPREKEISTNTEEEQIYTGFNIPIEPKG